MFNLSPKKEVKKRVPQKNDSSVIKQVKKVLSDENQKLILMVRS